MAGADVRDVDTKVPERGMGGDVRGETGNRSGARLPWPLCIAHSLPPLPSSLPPSLPHSPPSLPHSLTHFSFSPSLLPPSLKFPPPPLS